MESEQEQLALQKAILSIFLCLRVEDFGKIRRSDHREGAKRYYPAAVTVHSPEGEAHEIGITEFWFEETRKSKKSSEQRYRIQMVCCCKAHSSAYCPLAAEKSRDDLKICPIHCIPSIKWEAACTMSGKEFRDTLDVLAKRAKLQGELANGNRAIGPHSCRRFGYQAIEALHGGKTASSIGDWAATSGEQHYSGNCSRTSCSGILIPWPTIKLHLAALFEKEESGGNTSAGVAVDDIVDFVDLKEKDQTVVQSPSSSPSSSSPPARTGGNHSGAADADLFDDDSGSSGTRKKKQQNKRQKSAPKKAESKKAAAHAKATPKKAESKKAAGTKQKAVPKKKVAVKHAAKKKSSMASKNEKK